MQQFKYDVNYMTQGMFLDFDLNTNSFKTWDEIVILLRDEENKAKVKIYSKVSVVQYYANCITIHPQTYKILRTHIIYLSSYLRIPCYQYDFIIIIYSFESFYTSVSSNGVWMTASLLTSPGLFSVF